MKNQTTNKQPSGWEIISRTSKETADHSLNGSAIVKKLKTIKGDRKMKGLIRLFALTAIAGCFAFAGAGRASADAVSPEASSAITVTAENEGVFTFSLAEPSFDFGVVNANGEESSTGVTGEDGSSGAIYTMANVSAFTVTSAPVHTVRIFNASADSTIVWGSEDSLEMQIPTTGLGSGTSCGYKAFGTTGDGGAGDCDLGNLLHSLSVGNDAASETGQIDLKLNVANTDIAGSNSWTVNLTASAL